MIEIKNLETGLTYTDFVPGITPKIPTWLVCSNPKKDELLTIQQTFHIPWEDLEDALDEDERPRLELEPDHDPPFMKLVLRVPFGEVLGADEPHLQPTTVPAVVFLTTSHLITIQGTRLKTKRIRKPIGSRRKRPTPTILVLLDWLESVVKSFELKVDIIDQDLAKVEQVIFQSIRSSSIEEVFRLSRDTTYLDAALRGNLRAVYALKKAPQLAEYPELLDDLEDLAIDLQQQADLLRIYRDLIESSLDAFASVISNNQNDLLKVLASISLILMVPTLIASLYGMNLGSEFEFLPLANSPYAFWIILVLSLLLIVPIWFYLRKVDLL
ncbi:MAG: magnesium transporter CorA family protein [Candidatus Heimdallarchaeota archaeon]|nr:MAG: magnesium transporter CorA family protein [Candidatus Heimdallarchaeota archaeon]